MTHLTKRSRDVQYMKPRGIFQIILGICSGKYLKKRELGRQTIEELALKQGIRKYGQAQAQDWQTLLLNI